MIADRGLKTEDRVELLDVSGRRAMELRPGPNDVRGLAPGVYFVRSEPRGPSGLRKVILQ